MSVRRYVVLTPFAQPDVLAGVLKLRDIRADVVPTDSGVCVVHELSEVTFDDWDISELLGPPESSTETAEAESEAGGDTVLADDPDYVAGVLSKLSKYGVVLFSVELGEDVGLEAGVSGLVQAHRYLNGKRSEEMAAGLLLNSLAPAVEQLILGEKSADDLSGTIHHDDVTPSVLKRIVGRFDRKRNKPGEESGDTDGVEDAE